MTSAIQRESLAEIFARPDWQSRAACRGMAQDLPAGEAGKIFFPQRGQATRRAKKICENCPVKTECLEHALAVPEKFGIWGGISERERRPMRRRRKLEEGPTRKPIKHGTIGGERAHRRRGEKPCDECLAAAARYQQDARPSRAKREVS